MAKENYQLGDIVKLKKKHPCGSDEWKIHRIGMDFGLLCMGCNHYILLPRIKFLKAVKKLVQRGSDQDT